MVLTYELASKYLRYEPDTGKIYWIKDLARAKSGDEAGTARKDGYRHIFIKRNGIRSHRMAWLLHYGKLPENSIDHINGVKYDNRIVNLRDVTKRENEKNMPRPANNTSGFMGIYWNKLTKNWRVKIEVDGKQIHVGYFKEKSSAIQARIKANEKYGFHSNHGRAA